MYQSFSPEKLIPHDLTNHQYVTGNNIRYTENLNRVQPFNIIISSKDRNWDVETPQDYSNRLSNKYSNVYSIELIDGYVPSSGYTITQYNNSIYLQDKKDQVSTTTYALITIPEGNYSSIVDLTGKIETALRSANEFVGITYNVDYDYTTNRVTINSTGISEDTDYLGHFNLIFNDLDPNNQVEYYSDKSFIRPKRNDKPERNGFSEITAIGNTRHKYIKNSIGQIIGFKPINLTGQTSYTGQMSWSLRPHDYMALFITDNKNNDYSLVASQNSNINGAFAMIPISSTIKNVDDIIENDMPIRQQIINNGRIIKYFNPPIDIDQLRIKYITDDGNLYDFNGLDNYLLFEIKQAFRKEIPDTLQQFK